MSDNSPAQDDAPGMLGSEAMFADSITWQVWLGAEATWKNQQAIAAWVDAEQQWAERNGA